MAYNKKYNNGNKINNNNNNNNNNNYYYYYYWNTEHTDYTTHQHCHCQGSNCQNKRKMNPKGVSSEQKTTEFCLIRLNRSTRANPEW